MEGGETHASTRTTDATEAFKAFVPQVIPTGTILRVKRLRAHQGAEFIGEGFPERHRRNTNTGVKAGARQHNRSHSTTPGYRSVTAGGAWRTRLGACDRRNRTSEATTAAARTYADRLHACQRTGHGHDFRQNLWGKEGEPAASIRGHSVPELSCTSRRTRQSWSPKASEGALVIDRYI